MGISRRNLLGTVMAGASLVPAAARLAEAAAPMAGGQAPGFYRFQVGEFEVTRVHDGQFVRPLDAQFVRNAPLEQVQQALTDFRQPSDTLRIPITTTVVNTGDRLVLIDTGTGGHLTPTAASWMSNFRAAGYAPEQVDLVVISHFHGDHIQGLRDKDGNAVFPNAAVMVPEAEWAFWMDDGEMSRAPEGMQGAFKGVHRVFDPIAKDVEMFAGERELVPGLSALPAFGHTPGHNAFIVASGDARVLIWSDTTNKPELFVRNPGWHAVFDMDGAVAEATRLRLLDRAASEQLLVAGYHFPFPATGHITRDGQGYDYLPTFWQGG